MKTIKCLIYFMLILICIGCNNDAVSKNDEKPILYKINIKDINYLNSAVLNYNYVENSNKIFFQISKDSISDCFYYDKFDIDGKTIHKTSNSCSYSINNDEIKIDLEVKRIISNQPTVEEYITIEGSVFENGKMINLLIDNKEYKLLEDTYVKLLKKNMDVVLVDPKSEEIFDLDGVSIWEHGENLKKIELDLSEYHIIDKTS